MPEQKSIIDEQPIEYAKEYVEKINKDLEDLSEFYNNLKDKQISYQKIINTSLREQLRNLLMTSYEIEKKLDDIQFMKTSIPSWRF
ncbi:MAG: hypothetical protein CMI60_22705 [Parvibaculum sp.]|nr:hypothetical protein [Parvibaculum sp.]|tara:strand:- start:61 stop:318 length:258 start_codon:yes stop_codon:yes gene_type:complete